MLLNISQYVTYAAVDHTGHTHKKESCGSKANSVRIGKTCHEGRVGSRNHRCRISAVMLQKSESRGGWD